MVKSQPQVTNELKKWQEWLINHVPKPARWEVCEKFETFHGRVMSLHADTTTGHTRDTAISMHAFQDDSVALNSP